MLTVTPLETDTSTVVDLFAQGRKAAHMWSTWQASAPPPVVDLVCGHITRTPYLLRPADIETVARNTKHALGQINRSDVLPSCRYIEDWFAPLAWTYAFHYLLEQRGTLFTWQDFLVAYRQDPLLREFLAEPADLAIKEAVTKPGQQNSSQAWHWRLGNAYYSFLREMYVLVGGRAAGFDLRMHPLADVLFRADAWVNDTTISLYVPNKIYRADDTGRKPKTPDILADSPTPWRHQHIALDSKAKFGRLNTPEPHVVFAALSRAIGPRGHLTRSA